MRTKLVILTQSSIFDNRFKTFPDPARVLAAFLGISTIRVHLALSCIIATLIGVRHYWKYGALSGMANIESCKVRQARNG